MIPLSGPAEARLNAALTSSLVTSRFRFAVKSTTETVGTRRTGLGRNDVFGCGPSVARIARDGVEQPLAQSLRVNRREEAFLDSEFVIEDFGDRRQAVRRARRVRDDVVLLRIEFLLVDPEHDRLVLVLRGGRDDDVLRPGVEVRLRFCRIGEETCRLHDDVDLELFPWQLGRVALLEHPDLAAVDDERIPCRRDLALIFAVVRVVLEEVRVHLRIREVVEGDDLHLGMPLERGLQELTADTAEPVYRDASFHVRLPRARAPDGAGPPRSNALED